MGFRVQVFRVQGSGSKMVWKCKGGKIGPNTTTPNLAKIGLAKVGHDLHFSPLIFPHESGWLLVKLPDERHELVTIRDICHALEQGSPRDEIVGPHPIDNTVAHLSMLVHISCPPWWTGHAGMGG